MHYNELSLSGGDGSKALVAGSSVEQIICRLLSLACRSIFLPSNRAPSDTHSTRQMNMSTGRHT